MRIGLLLVLSIVPLSVTANSLVDSLSHVLSSRTILDTHRVDLLNQLGFEYWIIDPIQSENHGIQAIELARVLDYKAGAAYGHRIVGVAHWARGNYNPALEYLLKAYAFYTSLNDPLGLANTELNIGMVYSDQKDYEQAMDYFNQSVAGFEALKKEDRIATAYTKMGSIYANNQDYERAYDYFQKALAIHMKNQFIYGQAEVNNRLGVLFSDRGDYNKALTALFKSLEAGEERSDYHGISANYAEIGAVYLKKNDLQQAEKYLLKGKRLAENIDVKKTLKEIYSLLKDLEIKRNNPSKALYYFEQYNQVKDSLFNADMARQIANLQTQYATATQKQELKIREQEIALLEEEQRSNKLFYFMVVLGLLSFGSLVILFLKRQQSKNERALFTEQKLRKNQELLLASEQAKTKELSKELDQRNKELTAYTVNFIRKNELIADIKSSFTDIKGTAKSSTIRQLETLERKLNQAFQIDEDWIAFRKYFEEVHQSFFPVMKARHPDLSSNDLKLCILVRLNLSIKEMATMLGISPDSVKTARSRLRKKMDIPKSAAIIDYLIQLEQEAGI